MLDINIELNEYTESDEVVFKIDDKSFSQAYETVDDKRKNLWKFGESLIKIGKKIQKRSLRWDEEAVYFGNGLVARFYK